MITSDNIQGVISQIRDKDKKRIKQSNKEYIVLLLHCFNSGSVTQVILTNDYTRYQNVSKNGDCILSIADSIFNSIREV